ALVFTIKASRAANASAGAVALLRSTGNRGGSETCVVNQTRRGTQECVNIDNDDQYKRLLHAADCPAELQTIAIPAERHRRSGIAARFPCVAAGRCRSHYSPRGGAASGGEARDFVRLCQPRPPAFRGRAGEPRTTLLCRRCRTAQTAAPNRASGCRSPRALRFTYPRVGFGHMSR